MAEAIQSWQIQTTERTSHLIKYDKEFRCEHCGKLIFRYIAGAGEYQIQAKCKRCRGLTEKILDRNTDDTV